MAWGIHKSRLSITPGTSLNDDGPRSSTWWRRWASSTPWLATAVYLRPGPQGGSE